MFGDSFYAEFQVATVYDSGFFPNKLQLIIKGLQVFLVINMMLYLFQ